MKTYSIIENAPYDEDAPVSFWIEEKSFIWKFCWRRRIIGDYTIDNSRGELGDMPFFCRKTAKARIKLLKRQQK